MKASSFDKTKFALSEIKSDGSNHVERTKKFRRKKMQSHLKRYLKNLDKE
jgi:hypothetical protein